MRRPVLLTDQINTFLVWLISTDLIIPKNLTKYLYNWLADYKIVLALVLISTQYMTTNFITKALKYSTFMAYIDGLDQDENCL